MAHEWDFLPYKLRWLQTLQGEQMGDDECTSSPVVFSPPEALQTVVFEWDLPTFTRLLSSVVKGAQLSYPDDWIQVTWDFLRGVDCPVSICDAILECLQTNEDIQNWLSGFINETVGNVRGREISASQKEAPLNNVDESGCDLDQLWGSALYTVQILNRLNGDFLETVAASVNNQEVIAFIVGAIPVLETLPLDEFAQIVAKIKGFVKEFYEAGYDVDLEQEIACDLFCRARANGCKLTTQIITDYFVERAQAIEGFEDVWSTARTIIEAMANWQEMAGEKVVFAMMGANVGFLNFLNSALGMDFGEFQLKTRSGVPDDDWMLICEDCPPIGGCYDQTAGFADIGTDTEWVDDETYIRYARALENGDSASFELTFTEPQTLASFSMWTQVEGSASGTGNTNTADVTFYLDGIAVLTPFQFTRFNDFQYSWQPPGVAGIVGSITGAGTVFDRVVFTHQHAKLKAAIRGEVCLEAALPDACAGCDTFEEQVIGLGASWNGTEWTPDDARIAAINASSYADDYMAINNSTANGFTYNDAEACINRIGVGVSSSTSLGTEGMKVTVNGTDYPFTFAYPLTPASTPDRQILYVDIPQQPVESLVVTNDGAGGLLRVWTLRLFVCTG